MGGVRCGAEEPFDRQAGLWIASNTDSRPLSRLPVLSLSLCSSIWVSNPPSEKGRRGCAKWAKMRGLQIVIRLNIPPPLTNLWYEFIYVLSIVLGEQRVDTPTSS